MQNDLVANEPPVDEEEHRIPVVLLDMGPRSEQVDLHPRPAVVFFVFHQLIEKIVSENLENTVPKTASGRRCHDLEACALQNEMSFGKREGIVRAVGRDLA